MQLSLYNCFKYADCFSIIPYSTLPTSVTRISSLFGKSMTLQQDFQVMLTATYKKPISCKTAAFQCLQLLCLQLHIPHYVQCGKLIVSLRYSSRVSHVFSSPLVCQQCAHASYHALNSASTYACLHAYVKFKLSHTVYSIHIYIN